MFRYLCVTPILLSLLLASFCSGDEPSTSVDSRDEIAELRAEIAGLRKAVDRLSSRMAPDYAPVRIATQTPAGKPVAGCLVTIYRGSGETRIKASGESNDSGVALERSLPYGEYRLSVSTPEGHRASMRRVLVEIGKGLDRKIVIPEPDEWATLRIEEELDFSKLAGLRFGEYTKNARSGSYYTSYSPEPDEEPGKYWAFPTIGDGVEEVAMKLRWHLTREVPQPEGNPLEWSLTWGGATLPDLIAANKMLKVQSTNAKRYRPEANARYFNAKAHSIESITSSSQQEDYKVGFEHLQLEQLDFAQPVIRLPAGQLTVTLEGLYARASEEVASSLPLNDEDSGQQVWLEANVKRDSLWLPRLLELTQWSELSRTTRVHRDLELNPGSEAKLRLATP